MSKKYFFINWLMLQPIDSYNFTWWTKKKLKHHRKCVEHPTNCTKNLKDKGGFFWLNDPYFDSETLKNVKETREQSPRSPIIHSKYPTNYLEYPTYNYSLINLMNPHEYQWDFNHPAAIQNAQATTQQILKTPYKLIQKIKEIIVGTFPSLTHVETYRPQIII